MPAVMYSQAKTVASLEMVAAIPPLAANGAAGDHFAGQSPNSS